MQTASHRLPGRHDAATGLIRARTEATIRCCTAGGPAAIRQRLSELDQEWDVDRIVAAAASGAVLGGLLFGSVASRKWYLLPALAGGFMLQHALHGGCLPMDLLRQIGIRSAEEIDAERRELMELFEPPAKQAAGADIPALHPTGRPTANDFVETASGRIKPASQG
jgi:hypothetical protein